MTAPGPVGRGRVARPFLAVVRVEVPHSADGRVVGVDQHAVAAAHVAVEELHARHLGREALREFGTLGQEVLAADHRMRQGQRLRGFVQQALHPPLVGLHALEARCAAFGRHLRQVGGEGLAVVGVADLQVAHPVAGGLQRGGKGAHRSEDRQHLLRVVAHVVGLAAHLHHQVEHVGARDVEPGMGGVELVAEDEAEGGHACSLSELGSAVSAGDVEECL